MIKTVRSSKNKTLQNVIALSVPYVIFGCDLNEYVGRALCTNSEIFDELQEALILHDVKFGQ